MENTGVTIAVCDDDENFLAFVEPLLLSHCRDQGIDCSLHLFDRGETFWSAFAAEGFDIVLLDVMMPDMSGIELSQKVFSLHRASVIAFISSSPEFALRGYGVNAVDYLVKPPDEEALRGLLDKCLARHFESHRQPLLLKVGHTTQKVEVESILFLESRNKQVLLHCVDDTVTTTGKLSALQSKLPPCFVQTHKSYVANLNRVIAMERDFMVADNQARIPISRQFRKDAAQRYLDHVVDEV